MDDIVEERGRIGTSLATVYDAEGKQLKFDIREDEDQNVKLHETVDLLVVAGYFRARIKGLSAFDKVVGGMVWCISLCNVDVDVDLLYQENSTIGQKITLTEKIVKVLPKLKCPHAIEPHQIQGLDFIHIFPVVQWLVKKAIKAKEETADLLQSYAVSQFESRGLLEHDVEQKTQRHQIADCQADIKEAAQPQRTYKKHSDMKLEEETAEINCTLLEYGCFGQNVSPNERTETSAVGQKESEHPVLEEDISALMSSMSAVRDGDAKLSAIAVASLMDKQHIEKMSSDYAEKESERLSGSPTRGVRSSGVAHEVTDLETEREQLKRTMQELQMKEEELDKTLQTLSEEYSKAKESEEAQQAERRRIDELEELVDRESLEKLKSLMEQHEDTKQRETQFKERCKKELMELESEAETLRQQQSSETIRNQMTKELKTGYEVESSKFQDARLHLAELNKQMAAYQRKIDQVPSQTELNQYQRRFVELYNQIANKHKETKQFYILHNTLTDVKNFMDNEVTLLDSICSSYHIAVSSESCKEQYLRQIEQIVEGIKQNLLRVEKRCAEEKLRRDQMRELHQEMLDKQRLYYKTVKDFQEECKRNESLVAKLRNLGDEEP